MGTNYHLRLNRCEKCERYDEIHIGKSSAGWKFMFQYIKGKTENIRDWRNMITLGTIVDEYGKLVNPVWFWTLVQSKQGERFQLGLGEDMKVIDGYNFMEGDFS